MAFEECSEMARNEVRNFYHLKFNFYSEYKAVSSDGVHWTIFTRMSSVDLKGCN